MKLRASGEDYLEAILILRKKKGMVRSIDLAQHMEYSKASISHAVSVLKDGGFLTMGSNGYLYLTEQGREIAEKVYEKHQFFTRQLMEAGVEPKIAEEEACRMEHTISDASFLKLKEAAKESS
ncbi:MAG: metal-dependent transcriptional regulator [bacterium]|nr:metal-dependent transcriptional regulator [bacterium]